MAAARWLLKSGIRPVLVPVLHPDSKAWHIAYAFHLGFRRERGEALPRAAIGDQMRSGRWAWWWRPGSDAAERAPGRATL